MAASSMASRLLFVERSYREQNEWARFSHTQDGMSPSQAFIFMNDIRQFLVDDIVGRRMMRCAIVRVR
jgi:hypothetical protein